MFIAVLCLENNSKCTKFLTESVYLYVEDHIFKVFDKQTKRTSIL